jgi:acetylornithine deacetylase/succinyl-diaminopimelate desuccinylase-like protein
MKLTQRFTQSMIDMACHIQQIPSPTFHEELRAGYLQQEFYHLGLAGVEIDETGNCWGLLPGGSAPPLVISAHLDTVHTGKPPIPLSRHAGYIQGPGIGDNSLGVAGIFGLASFLKEQGIKLPGDVYFVGNVGEEGMGNLVGMRAVVDRMRDQPAAYLIVEGMGLGSVYHRGLGVIRYNIEVTTPGGHSWADFGNPSAVHILADLITRLTAIPIPSNPRTTINIGTIQGGISVNTIAAQAELTLDLRSEGNAELEHLNQQVLACTAAYQRPGVNVNCRLTGRRPSGEIPANHPIIYLAQDVLGRLRLPVKLGIASSDANIPLSLAYPAVCIGLTTGGNAHTDNEFIDLEPFQRGFIQLFELTRRAWEILPIE